MSQNQKGAWTVHSNNIHLRHREPSAWGVSSALAQRTGEQFLFFFFSPVVLVWEDLILEAGDPEAWGPETRNPGIPGLVTHNLKAVPAKEEVSMF